jgi:hypothetical protein
MKNFQATTITMLEKATGVTIVPPKTRKSDKTVVIRFGAGKPTMKIR